MQRVVRFNDVFPAVGEPAVTQKKTLAAKREILLVIARDSVGHKRKPGAIESSSPTQAACAHSEFDGLVDFRVGIRFVPSLVPAPSPKQADPIVNRLLEICAEAVFDCGL